MIEVPLLHNILQKQIRS